MQIFALLPVQPERIRERRRTPGASGARLIRVVDPA